MLILPFIKPLTGLWLFLLATFATAETYDSQTRQPLGYHQHLQHFHMLERKLIDLEHRNPAYYRLFSVGVTVVLDMALELAHAMALQQHSPDYFYQRPFIDATGLEHTTRDLLYYAIAHGHVPAFFMGAGTWISENFGELPNLYTSESLFQIGLLAGAVAGGYSWLHAYTMLSSNPFADVDTGGIAMFQRLETDARRPFRAAMVLNHYKSILQAAAVTLMVVRSFLVRRDRKSEIEEIRTALTLAREQLLSFYRHSREGGDPLGVLDPRLRGNDEKVRGDDEKVLRDDQRYEEID